MAKVSKEPIIADLQKLPESWKWAQMNDIGASEKNAIVDGPFGSNLKVSDYVENGPVPVLTTKNLTGDYSDVRYITHEKFEELKRSEVRPNDILMAKIGSCGKTGIYPVNMPSAIIPANLMKITVHPEIEQKFVYYYFDSLQFQKHLKTIIKATAQPAFGVTNFKRLPFPLAPPEQQKRIVAKIEELFSHIDAGIEALKKAKQLLKQYRQSVLKAAVTGELLGSVFPTDIYRSIDYGLESLGQGWSPRCDREPSLTEDVWGVIKTTAVQALEYLQEENKRLPEKLEPRPHLEVRAGDILVTRAGPRVRVGVCCLVKETRKKLMICDKVYRLRSNTGAILPEYLEIVLNAPQVQREIENIKTGISDSGVNLTQKRFVELKIPYPSISVQKQLISLTYEKADAIARLENELESQSVKAEKNKQSVLASAFTGGI